LILSERGNDRKRGKSVNGEGCRGSRERQGDGSFSEKLGDEGRGERYQNEKSKAALGVNSPDHIPEMTVGSFVPDQERLEAEVREHPSGVENGANYPHNSE